MSQTKAQLLDPVDLSIVTADLADDAVTAAKLASNAVVNASVDASAAIAGTKISPDFGSQAVSTTGGLSINGATVFNESGADVDFRIEGNGEPNLFFIDAANQRVGIGTATPSQKFHIKSSAPAILFEDTGANGSATSIIEDNNGFIKIRCDNGNAGTGSGIGFEVDASERMRIDSSGNVGIGTSSPSTKFEVRDSSATGISSRSTSTQATDGNKALKVRNNSDTDTFNVSYKGQGYFAGKVGIGTTSPTEELTIESATPAVMLKDTDLANSYVQLSAGDGDMFFSANDTAHNGQFLFRSGLSGTFTERARIDSSGNLGLGASITTARLDVARLGSSWTGATPAAGTVAHFHNGNNGSTSPAYLGLSAGTASASGINFGDADDNDVGTIKYSHSDNSFRFNTNASERVRIDSSGRLLLGRTSGDFPLDVNGAARISGIFYMDNDKRIQWGGSNVSYIEGNDDSHIAFGIASERMRLTGTGLGIGTTSPTAELEIFHATDPEIHLNINTHGDVGIIRGDADGLTLTGNGSSDQIRFKTDDTERMRIDSSGNLGIGTTSPGHKLEIRATTATHQLVSINRQNSNTAALFLGNNSSENAIIAGNNTDILFGRDLSDSFTERMRLRNDGKLLLNRSNLDGSGMLQIAVSGAGITTATADQGTVTHLEFRNQNGNVGTIKTNGTGTSFNTSSDYRLKENVEVIADGIKRLKQLKPKKFNFISDETSTLLDGFLAHEVSPIIPEAVSGEKDEVDTDGKPLYQEIDHSKLVPLLVAAVQELIGRVETLEAA